MKKKYPKSQWYIFGIAIVILLLFLSYGNTKINCKPGYIKCSESPLFKVGIINSVSCDGSDCMHTGNILGFAESFILFSLVFLGIWKFYDLVKGYKLVKK